MRMTGAASRFFEVQRLAAARHVSLFGGRQEKYERFLDTVVLCAQYCFSAISRWPTCGVLFTWYRGASLAPDASLSN